jgi:hypothetical protein
MESAGLSSVARPGSYWRTSRAPRYSLLFALPLLVFYQVLAALQSSGAGGAPGPGGPGGPGAGAGLRNGADVIFQSLFTAVAGIWGPALFMACLIAVGLWLVVRDVRTHGGAFRPSVFLRMLLESAVLALVFGVVVGTITAKLLSPLGPLASPSPAVVDWWTKLMLSLGAGLYEELLFRVVLVALLAALAHHVFGWRPWPAGVFATVLGAALFSAFHYVGPYGDRLMLYSFTFRMIAGIFFSALYLLRGFGITAWTHALYDLFLLAT